MPLHLSTPLRYQQLFLEHLELACRSMTPDVKVNVELYVPLFQPCPLMVISLSDPEKRHCVSVDFYTHIQEGKYEVGIYRTEKARERWLGTDLDCPQDDYEFRMFTTTRMDSNKFRDIEIAGTVGSAVRMVVGFLHHGPYIKD